MDLSFVLFFCFIFYLKMFKFFTKLSKNQVISVNKEK